MSTFTNDHHKEVSVCEGRRGLEVRGEMKGDSEVVPLSWAHAVKYDVFLFYVRTSINVVPQSPMPESLVYPSPSVHLDSETGKA